MTTTFFKKLAFHSLVCAALKVSASGFVVPSSFSHKTIASVGENGFCKVGFTDESPFCAASQTFTSLKAATDDQDLHVFLDDMLAMSKFVYEFNNIRSIVRDNKGKTKKKLFGKDVKVEYVEPALILTDMGSQERDDNKQLKYTITLPAILRFLENNRRWFKDPDGDGELEFDDREKSEPFILEEQLKEQMVDNIKIIDYDDRFGTNRGGLVYGVVINLTQKWITVVFRGTIGLSDVNTDRDFRLDHESFFGHEGDITVDGGKPATHRGFTDYLVSNREVDSIERPYIDRILACVNGEFETLEKNHNNVKREDFKLFVTGHSMGGGLANLFAFRTAQLLAKNDTSVAALPKRVKAMTFASPCVGNFDYNAEFQELERNGFLRHVRIANEGDVVPTNAIYPPFSIAIKGNTKVYTQNGVNLFLKSEEKLVDKYRNTKNMWSQTDLFNALGNHALTEHSARLKEPANQAVFEQTLEELYQIAGDFTA